MESMLNKLVAVNGKFKEHIAVVDVGGCFAEACMQYTEHVKLLRLEYPEKAATTVGGKQGAHQDAKDPKRGAVALRSGGVRFRGGGERGPRHALQWGVLPEHDKKDKAIKQEYGTEDNGGNTYDGEHDEEHKVIKQEE
ncbi:hypothetical protein BSKO_04587 [Bryopsis sp. KO-2023]|nr:hypothetical protein BSKO_04587 [Bryopsis sp. KO-2023]